MHRVAILNSHQSKTPVGTDPWVQNTLAAVEYAVQQGWQVVSSIGLNTWELVTWAVGHHGGNLTLVISESDNISRRRDEICRDFDLDPVKVEFHFFAHSRGRPTPKDWWEPRDRRVCEMADVLVPVSIRTGGRLERLLSECSTEKTTVERFRIPYRPEPHHERKFVDPTGLNQGFRDWGNSFLIHWTRTCHGPWSGETIAQYYTDLVRPGDHYCRSGLLTLQRILAEQTIRGSSWRIGGKKQVVAFTELSPLDSMPLMRWRTRWSRWSFEPYGIAIRKDEAVQFGVRPVRYVTEEEWDALPSEEKPFSHRIGRKADVWPAEREWRCEGDVNLADMPPDEIKVIVRTADEIGHVSPHTGFEVIPLMT